MSRIGSRWVHTSNTIQQICIASGIEVAGEVPVLVSGGISTGEDIRAAINIGAAGHRVLRTSTFLNWEAEGCPEKGNNPGEGEVIAKTAYGSDVYRYSARRPVEGDTGDLESMCMYAGEGVGKIKDIPSAAELMERLWKEFENK